MEWLEALQLMVDGLKLQGGLAQVYNSFTQEEVEAMQHRRRSLYSHAVQQAASAGKGRHGNSKGRQCKAFNVRGCTRTSCCRPHRCKECDGPHPLYECEREVNASVS